MESGVVWLLHLGAWIGCVSSQPRLGWEEMGVSLNGGTPISHPKMIIFSRKTHGCWGNPPFQETPKWVPVLLVENLQSFLYISRFSTKITLVPLQKDSELAGKITTWHVHPMGFHSPSWSSFSMFPIPIFITILKGDSREPPIMATPYMLSFPLQFPHL